MPMRRADAVTTAGNKNLKYNPILLFYVLLYVGNVTLLLERTQIPFCYVNVQKIRQNSLKLVAKCAFT